LGFCQGPCASSRWHRQRPSSGRGPGCRSPGVRVGTRFIAATEAGVHPEYVKALIAGEPEDTVVTEAFSEGWPNAPHRVLRFCIEEAQNFKGDIVGYKKLISTGEMVPVMPLESFTMTSEATGRSRPCHTGRENQ